MHADPPWVGDVRLAVRVEAEERMQRHYVHGWPRQEMQQLRIANWHTHERIALAFGEITHALPPASHHIPSEVDAAAHGITTPPAVPNRS